jgi:hypothetical protein
VGDYFCCLCNGIIINRKMCNECESLFCNKCLQDNLNFHNQCPVCYNQPFENAKITKQMSNYLNDIIIFCPFDCLEKFKYQNLKFHLIECEKFEKSYSCNECQDIVKAKKNNDFIFSSHLEICEYRKNRCKYCGKDYLWRDCYFHENLCILKPINCEKCFVPCLKEFESAHRKYYCKVISAIVRAMKI